MKNTELPIEETKGFKIAYAFRPFINPKCTEIDEIVKDLASTINNNFTDNNTNSDSVDKLKYIIQTMSNFTMGFKVTLNGLTYQQGINENSFYKEVSRLTNEI